MFPFFGLAPEYKLGLHTEIFSLCYHGQGGFTWDEVYNLPIHLRRFYIMEINKVIEKRNKEESTQQTKSVTSAPKFTPPRK
jgi:hypothetical protein